MKKLVMDQFIKKYWSYYIEIENQLLETQKYVEFDKKNYNTYSMEYLKLYQIICSEIDGCAKVISLYSDSSFKIRDATIKQWGFQVQQIFPEITKRQVSFNGNDLLIPWRNWEYVIGLTKDGKKNIKHEKGKVNPDWWVKYGNVKHARMNLESEDANYADANLKNVVYALAGLYILEREFIEYLYFEKKDTGHLPIAKSGIFTDFGFKHIEKIK